MGLLQRKLQHVIEDRMFKGKAIILVGARQVGKSTTSQQEIDFVEERDGQLNLYEMKWNPKKGKAKVPSEFTKA